jgi:hypothetical protein
MKIEITPETLKEVFLESINMTREYVNKYENDTEKTIKLKSLIDNYLTSVKEDYIQDTLKVPDEESKISISIFYLEKLNLMLDVINGINENIQNKNIEISSETLEEYKFLSKTLNLNELETEISIILCPSEEDMKHIIQYMYTTISLTKAANTTTDIN